jgi:hypothetical protein
LRSPSSRMRRWRDGSSLKCARRRSAEMDGARAERIALLISGERGDVPRMP